MDFYSLNVIILSFLFGSLNLLISRSSHSAPLYVRHVWILRCSPDDLTVQVTNFNLNGDAVALEGSNIIFDSDNQNFTVTSTQTDVIVDVDGLISLPDTEALQITSMGEVKFWADRDLILDGDAAAFDVTFNQNTEGRFQLHNKESTITLASDRLTVTTRNDDDMLFQSGVKRSITATAVGELNFEGKGMQIDAQRWVLKATNAVTATADNNVNIVSDPLTQRDIDFNSGDKSTWTSTAADINIKSDGGAEIAAATVLSFVAKDNLWVKGYDYDETGNPFHNTQVNVTGGSFTANAKSLDINSKGDINIVATTPYSDGQVTIIAQNVAFTHDRNATIFGGDMKFQAVSGDMSVDTDGYMLFSAIDDASTIIDIDSDTSMCRVLLGTCLL